MTTDAAYALTRREGSTGSIIRTTGDGSIDPKTGDITPAETTTTVRWLYKEPTSYKRIVRSKATQQDIGMTTFIMWTKDVPFSKLDPDDRIVQDGVTYYVRTSRIEDKTSFVVTADEVE